jgi:hypothetical protein
MKTAFRYSLRTIEVEITEGTTVQQAWAKLAAENSIDASRAMDFKLSGEKVPGDEEAEEDVIYSATVALSKNG